MHRLSGGACGDARRYHPQAAAPIIEQATNRRAFTGRPVEPHTLKNRQPFMRAAPGTSEMSQFRRQLGYHEPPFHE